jgi:hypothetical protein
MLLISLASFSLGRALCPGDLVISAWLGNEILPTAKDVLYYPFLEIYLLFWALHQNA